MFVLHKKAEDGFTAGPESCGAYKGFEEPFSWVREPDSTSLGHAQNVPGSSSFYSTLKRINCILSHSSGNCHRFFQCYQKKIQKPQVGGKKCSLGLWMKLQDSLVLLLIFPKLFLCSVSTENVIATTPLSLSPFSL